MTTRSAGAAGLVLVAVLAAGCGEDGGPINGPTASPSPTGSGPRNMRLLSRLSLAQLSPGASSAAGNWGYTAPDGRRFALTGLSDGLSVVEVTDPRNPRVAGHFPAASSAWREVKTYGPYAYVSTEARIGMDIVDLRSMRRVNTWARTFASAHSLWIDEARGLGFVNGTRDTTGRATGMRILDLARSPEDPRELGAWTNFYVHDGYTRGTLYFAAAINEGFLSIMEMADPAAPRELTRFNTGGRFTHNAWLTDDGRHVFTTDEVPNRPLEGWDISNPMAPRKVSEYIGAPNTIPHNVMVDGNRLVVAHYTEGVHLLDISNPASLRVLGSYDTFEPVASGFHGAWGAYIFPGSNIILVSDIEGGLFVVEYTP